MLVDTETSRLSKDRFATPSKSLSRLKIITATIGIGIFYNNIIRFFPFPSGRSLNDLVTTADNIPSIAFNVIFYACVLCVVWKVVPQSIPLKMHSGLLYAYCSYVFVQSIFRPDPLWELGRGAALTIMLLSADWLGKYLGSDTVRLDYALEKIWYALVGVLFVGVTIGIAIPESVNWGGGQSSGFSQQDRAEFFFFSLTPVVTVVLSLFMIMTRLDRKPTVWLSVATVFLVVTLAFRTQGRNLLLNLGLVGAIFLWRYFKKSAAVISLAAIPLVLINAEQAMDLLKEHRFLYETPDVDYTTGRLELNLIILSAFSESPCFGHGAEQMRNIIQDANPRAKTEHGYSMHLGSYGIFSGMFYAYILAGFIAAVRILLRRSISQSGRSVVNLLSFAVGSVTVVWVLLGFIGAFGSATAFYDWFAVLCVSIAVSFWTSIIRGRPVPLQEASHLSLGVSETSSEKNAGGEQL